jgi:hypothetical protein
MLSLDLRANNVTFPSGGWSNPQIFNSTWRIEPNIKEKS